MVTNDGLLVTGYVPRTAYCVLRAAQKLSSILRAAERGTQYAERCLFAIHHSLTR